MKPDLSYQPTYNDFLKFYAKEESPYLSKEQETQDKQRLQFWELSDQQERKVIGFEPLTQ